MLGLIANNIKVKIIENINLTTISWVTSGQGKYYAPAIATVDGDVIGVEICNWNNIRVDDFIQPYVGQANGTVSLLSNKNSFYTGSSGSSYANISLKIVYT